MNSKESLLKIRQELEDYYGSDIAYYPNTQKAFKCIGLDIQILDILKNKQVIICYLKQSENVDRYNAFIEYAFCEFPNKFHQMILKVEEFELLKKWVD